MNSLHRTTSRVKNINKVLLLVFMFIEINGTILDKKEHNRKVILLKRLLQYEFSEIIRKYDFKKKEDGFINEETGLKAILVFREAEQKPL